MNMKEVIAANLKWRVLLRWRVVDLWVRKNCDAFSNALTMLTTMMVKGCDYKNG